MMQVEKTNPGGYWAVSRHSHRVYQSP